MTIPTDIQSLIDQELALGHYAGPEDVLRRAMEALRNEREATGDAETLAGIGRGLADSAAGRYKTLEDFDRDFRARHGIGDDL
jgi:hypothetical protein